MAKDDAPNGNSFKWSKTLFGVLVLILAGFGAAIVSNAVASATNGAKVEGIGAQLNRIENGVSRVEAKVDRHIESHAKP